MNIRFFPARSLRFVAVFMLVWLYAGIVAAAGPGKPGIASAHPLATRAGYEVLEQGGNAFDAAVAVAGALAVVEPHSSGLGGGGFFLLYIADQDRYVFIDARETAPAAVTPGLYADENGKPVRGRSLNGPLAAGIPGEPAGLVHLATRYGRLPLKASLAPAIGYAEQGFAAYRRMLIGLKFRRRTAEQWPAFGEVFYPQGRELKAGERVVQSDLAATLERLANEGFDGYYKGTTARLLVDGVRAAGGIWSHEDLENYRVVEREPVRSSYRGTRIVSAPPPSSGGIALTNMLNIVAGFEFPQLTAVERKHVLIEAMRRAYRDRALYLGDPDFVNIPADRLMHPYYADGQRSSIRLDRATRSIDLPGLWPADRERPQTTHFSIIDAAGNRVAATITINGWYGSAFMPPGTGVILNNEMDDFAMAPGVPNGFNLLGGVANSVAPGKRPLSSMTPTFLESDRGVAILGTPGGSRIITMVLLGTFSWIDGATAQQMVEQKRFHHQYYPDQVVYEEGAFTDEERAGLEARGHKLVRSRRNYGNMNVVTWDYDTGKVETATDPRGRVEGRMY